MSNPSSVITTQPHLPTATPIHPAYRPDIDGLRAVAVLLVVVFHAFPTLLPGGFVGVDVFFIISGYLISTILLEGLRTKSFQFSTFYARRIKRIFPALLAVLLACYGFGWFALLAEEYKQLGKHMAGGAGFIANFIFWREAGYFDNAADTKPLLHLWSLGIEEQFYLLWPLVLWAAHKKKINVLLTLVVVGLGSFVWNVKATYSHSVEAFYAPWTRFWELLCGSFLAWSSLHQKHLNANPSSAGNTLWQRVENLFARTFQPSQGTLRQCQSILGMLLIGVGTCLLSKEAHFPGFWALLPTTGAVLLIAAGPQAWINRVILSNRLFVWIGLISYPLYLWHYPLLSFARIIESKTPSARVRIVAMVVAVGLAWLTYRFIEKPLRFGKKNEKFKILLLLVFMGMVGGVGFITYQKGGFAFRHGKLGRMYAQFTFSPWLGIPPHPSIVLLGDSHAGHFGPGLIKSGLGSSTADYSKGGCLPFYDVDVYSPSQKKGDCKKHANAALALLEKSPETKVVVLAGRGPIYLTGEDVANGKTHKIPGWGMTLENNPTLTDRVEIYRTGLRNTLTWLLVHNKKVIFVLDNPELGFDPRICVARPLRFWSRPKSPCAISRESFEQRTAAYRQLVREMLQNFPQVTVFDAAQPLCDQNHCWAIKEERMLYTDTNHLSEDGATYLAQFLVPLLRKNLQEAEQGN